MRMAAAFISYEWLRDGVTIIGANESRYEFNER